ncbi:hypothetical protein AQJ11_44130 [Streptomyces corchorusii]|uniref:Uncharacterized protein n=2 Tax=Streptomyces TaxID=1883 RepID=A0A124HIY5_STRCK|nr:hypothetical protein [Streptomyces corchorusii]KUN14774.1 hypothetical protein AQJ11_44130 [Streptomyces corchorusii]
MPRQEREAAVRSWLLLSAASADTSRTEWDRTGIALLHCGALLSVIRMSTELVEAAAGSNEPGSVRDFLEAALFGGPVFVDVYTARYYALVPASAADRPEWRERRHAPHAEILGRGSYVGVPRPGLDEPHSGHFSYWCVPMHGPADLCDPDAVSQLVAHGRHRLTTREAVSGR